MKAFSKAHRTGLITLAALLVLALTPVAAHAPGAGPGTASPRGHRSRPFWRACRSGTCPSSAAAAVRRPSPACRPTSSCTTWAAPAAACGRTTDAGATWTAISDGFFEAGSIGAIEVAESNPNVIYVGTGSACPRGNVSPGRRHVQVHRRRQDVAAHRPAQRRLDRPHPDPPDQSRRRLRRGARQSVRAEQGARRLPLARRRHDLGARSSRSATAPAPSTSRWT